MFNLNHDILISIAVNNMSMWFAPLRIESVFVGSNDTKPAHNPKFSSNESHLGEPPYFVVVVAY